MKKMITLALCLSAFAFAGASAQTATPDKSTPKPRREQRTALTPEQRAERQTRHLTEHLSLTPDQQTSVAAINLKYAKQVQTLKGNGELSRDKRMQLGELKRSREAELRQLLSGDQYKRYAELRDEHRAKRQQVRGRRGNS